MSPQSDTTTIVLVSPFEEDHFSLGRFLISTGFRVHRVRSRQEALAVIRNNRVAVVISERDLPEGDWKDVLQELTPLVDAPFLIVTSRHADNRLWAEVLNLGGHDVLPKPFHAGEVTRVVGLAYQRWAGRQEQTPAKLSSNLRPNNNLQYNAEKLETVGRQ